MAGMQNVFLTVIFGSILAVVPQRPTKIHCITTSVMGHVDTGGLARPEELTARAKTCVWQYVGQLLEREKALIQQQARESISMMEQFSLPSL